MRKVFFYFEGGLGDVLLQFFSNKHITGLPAYVAEFDCYTKVVLNVQNASAAELFRFDESFNEIQVFSYNPAARDTLQNACMDDGYWHWGGVPPGICSPRIRLSHADGVYLGKVLPRQPFILCHTRSGKGFFNWHNVNLSLLADAAEKIGCSLVLVGGSSDVSHEPAHQSDHPAVVNLVGRANPRLVCEIANRAAGYVGSFSCYMIAAMMQGTSGVALKPAFFHDDYVDLARRHNIRIYNFDAVSDSKEFYDLLVRSSVHGISV
jgi:hypothetical protein